MRFDAVIFDLDGTLLDTLADIAEAANQVLAAEGCPIHPVESYRTFVGDGVRVLFRRTLPPARLTDDLLERCIAGFHETYDREWNARTTLYPGIAELLTELNQRNLPLGVLSNKPHPFTLQCVETFLADWSFAQVRGQMDGIPTKPDPTSALMMAEAFQLSPERILYIGDTSTDMQTAVNAGFFPLGVCWGFRSAEELQEQGAQTLVEHPQEILALLDSEKE